MTNDKKRISYKKAFNVIEAFVNSLDDPVNPVTNQQYHVLEAKEPHHADLTNYITDDKPLTVMSNIKVGNHLITIPNHGGPPNPTPLECQKCKQNTDLLYLDGTCENCCQDHSMQCHQVVPNLIQGQYQAENGETYTIFDWQIKFAAAGYQSLPTETHNFASPNHDFVMENRKTGEVAFLITLGLPVPQGIFRKLVTVPIQQTFSMFILPDITIHDLPQLKYQIKKQDGPQIKTLLHKLTQIEVRIDE